MAMKPSLKETIMKTLSTPIFMEAAVLLSLSLAGPISAWADAPQHHDQVPGCSARLFRNDPLFHRRTTSMPMIDVYVPTDLFPVSADRQLAEELTAALFKAEGVANPGPTHTNNTGAYIHRMPPSTVNTAAQGSVRTVRVQVVTPPGVLSRAGQKQLVAEATEIVARISGDPSQAGRTWVLLTEAAEGGWGIAGTAFGKEEFAALATKAKG